MEATSNAKLAGVRAKIKAQNNKIARHAHTKRNGFILLLLRFQGISATGASQNAAF